MRRNTKCQNHIKAGKSRTKDSQRGLHKCIDIKPTVLMKSTDILTNIAHRFVHLITYT